MRPGALPLVSCGAEERRGLFSLKTDIALDDARLRALKAVGRQELDARVPAVETLAAQLGFRGEARPLELGTFHLSHVVASPRAVVVRSSLPGIFARDLSLGIERSVRAWMAAQAARRLVPETFAVGYAAEGAPFDHAVLAYSEGEPVRESHDTALDSRPETLAQMGRALRSVHLVEGAGAGLLDVAAGPTPDRPVGVHRQWRDYVLLNLRDHVEACVSIGLVEAGLRGRILGAFERCQRALEGRPMRLLHGDPGNHNFLVERNGGEIATLLDWEDALVGDPLFDVAMWLSFHPPRRHEHMLAGYASTGPAVEERRLIALYFLRIALSKTVHRHRFGIGDGPGREPAHHRIGYGLQALERLT